MYPSLRTKGTSKNSDFFVSTPTVGALGEEALRGEPQCTEDSSTELPKVGALKRRRNRGKSAFLEVPDRVALL